MSSRPKSSRVSVAQFALTASGAKVKTVAHAQAAHHAPVVAPAVHKAAPHLDTGKVKHLARPAAKKEGNGKSSAEALITMGDEVMREF